MNRLLLKLSIITTVGSLLSSNPISAQILPPQKRPQRVEITQGPALESAHDDLAIVRNTAYKIMLAQNHVETAEFVSRTIGNATPRRHTSGRQWSISSPTAITRSEPRAAAH